MYQILIAGLMMRNIFTWFAMQVCKSFYHVGMCRKRYKTGPVSEALEIQANVEYAIVYSEINLLRFHVTVPQCGHTRLPW